MEKNEHEVIILLLAHLSVADELIHDNEISFIYSYIEKNKINSDVKQEVEKIFGDLEDKITLQAIFDIIRKYTKEQKFNILELCISFVLADGFLNNSEEKIFKQYLKISEIDEKEYEQLKTKKIDEKNATKNQKKSKDTFFDSLAKSFLRISKNISFGDLKKMFQQQYNNFLLKGAEYKNAILASSKIAKEDILYVKTELEKTTKSSKKLLKKLNKILSNNTNKKDEFEKDFLELIKDFQVAQRKVIETQLKDFGITLEKIERASEYYTISFIGKTKAGKSTLHSVITGKGDEFIGKGKQRTTRYNRVYEWDKIRIIDTPGIGAPNGKTDEEIAKSVIDESDIICYVLKNDSIQETEFNFLRLIKEHNKPVLILLNIKGNIEESTRLKIFLKEPEKWFTRTDENSIQGHLERIQEYTEQHYTNNLFKIFPTHFLAAKMANEEKYKAHSKTLYKASHIQDFLDYIRIQIIDEGTIRKSKTIIDGALYVLNNNLKQLHDFNKQFTDRSITLEKNKNEISKKINLSYSEKSAELEKFLQNSFIELEETHAMSFANNNYDAQKEDIDKKWKKFLLDIKFEQKIEEKIKDIGQKYANDVKEALKDFEENLEFFEKLNTKDVNFNLTNLFNTKALVGITATLISLAGLIVGFSNPIGWALMGIGAVVGWLSNLFKSKQQKIQEATGKLYSSIKESIQKHKSEQIKEIINNFEKMHKNLVNKLEKSLNKILESVKEICKDFENEITIHNKSIERLNTIFAQRIINYLVNEQITIQESTISVKREFNKEFIISSPKNFDKTHAEKITQIIQERVEFNIQNEEKK